MSSEAPEYANFRAKLKPSGNEHVLTNPTVYTASNGVTALAYKNEKMVVEHEKAKSEYPVVASVAAAAAAAETGSGSGSGSGAKKVKKVSSTTEKKKKTKKKVTAKEEAPVGEAPVTASRSAAPPPGGPGAPPEIDSDDDFGGDAGAGAADGANALFAEINAGGEGLRAMLKKAQKGPVQDELPASAVDKPAAPTPAPKKAAAAPTIEPKLALDGKKWCVEGQIDNDELVVECTDFKQTVAVYKCERSTLQIKNKCNNIILDGCKKFQCIFENAMSNIEMINCVDTKIQCTGTAPSMSIESCDNITVYLTEENLATAHIVTSKISSINLCRPKPDDEWDVIEDPIPEQFVTVFKDGAWFTEAVSHDD